MENEIIYPFRLGKYPNKSSSNRFLTSSIWLGNNSLTSTKNLDELVEKKLENNNGSSSLLWLDLSYNKLTDIGDEILKFQNLTILYLHGNNILDVNKLLKLRYLKNLRSLTIHGNPVEKMPNYRRYIVAILPQISNLDFSPILEYEKKRALPTGFYKIIKA